MNRIALRCSNLVAFLAILVLAGSATADSYKLNLVIFLKFLYGRSLISRGRIGYAGWHNRISTGRGVDAGKMSVEQLSNEIASKLEKIHS